MTNKETQEAEQRRGPVALTIGLLLACVMWGCIIWLVLVVM